MIPRRMKMWFWILSTIAEIVLPFFLPLLLR